MSMGALVRYEWETPVSKIPAGQSGRFHIIKRKCPAGTSFETGEASGISEVLFTKDVIFTQLKDDPLKKSIPWMSDTPMEYYSAVDLVTRTKGSRVLVGGLGLGLITHLLANRMDIEEIVVVELEPDVIKLVEPSLPKKVKVIGGDFLKFLSMTEKAGDVYDTVIADIWKTGFEDADEELMRDCQMMMQDFQSTAEHLFWAFQHKIDEEELSFAVHYLDRQRIQLNVITTSGD